MEKIFLFDLYGIIFKKNNYDMLYQLLKPSVSIKDFIHEYRDSEYSHLLEKGLISTNSFMKQLLKNIDSHVSYEDFIDAHKKAMPEVYQDTIDLIKKLKSKNYRVGIISNLKELNVIQLQNTVDLNYIDLEFFSCYIHCSKPEDAIFKHVAKVTNPKGNLVYFFDDSKENCIAALKFGIKAINTKGDRIIDDFKKYVDKSDEIL